MTPCIELMSQAERVAYADALESKWRAIGTTEIQAGAGAPTERGTSKRKKRGCSTPGCKGRHNAHGLCINCGYRAKHG